MGSILFYNNVTGRLSGVSLFLILFIRLLKCTAAFRTEQGFSRVLVFAHRACFRRNSHHGCLCFDKYHITDSLNTIKRQERFLLLCAFYYDRTYSVLRPSKIFDDSDLIGGTINDVFTYDLLTSSPLHQNQNLFSRMMVQC